MTKVKPIRVPDLQGGLWSGEETLADDNQLTVAKNVFYNKDGILQSRRGQRHYGNPVPDAVTLVHNCDSTTNWVATDDAVNVTSGTAKVGSGSVQWDVDVSNSANDYATLTNAAITTADISSTKGSARLFFYTPASAFTDLTDVRFKLGSDSSNYYEWTISTSDLTEGGWKFLVLDFDDATTTGSPVDTGIDYAQVIINYDAAYADRAGWRIDQIHCVSGTSIKPMMSLKYFKASDTDETRYLHTNVGTSIFEFDESTEHWFPIKLGLTENTRFASAAYKNIMYLTNGVDNYMSYDGAAVSEHTGANTYKGKFLLLAADIGYIAGDPSTPTTVGYTGATPSNLQTFTNAIVIDEDDSSGKITGIMNLGPIVIVTKEKKIYELNVATPSREPIDYSDGAVSDRCLTQVENSVYFLNERGVYTLAQRKAVTGNLRADPITDDIQQIIDSFDNRSNACAIYSQDLRNFYLFADTNDDSVNDACLVGSILAETKQEGYKRAFTEYTGTSANEAVIYEDSNGDRHILIANALSGQMKEIEFGTNDNGAEIEYIVETREHDFGVPELAKTYEFVDIFGFISEISELDFTVYVDDLEVSEATIQGEDYVVSGAGSVYYLSGSALATTPLGGSGGEGSGTTFYPFKVRIPLFSTGNRIKIRAYSNSLDTQFMLTKYSIYPQGQTFEFFFENHIA